MVKPIQVIAYDMPYDNAQDGKTLGYVNIIYPFHLFVLSNWWCKNSILHQFMSVQPVAYSLLNPSPLAQLLINGKFIVSPRSKFEILFIELAIRMLAILEPRLDGSSEMDDARKLLRPIQFMQILDKNLGTTVEIECGHIPADR